MKTQFINPYLENPADFDNKPFFFAEYHYKEESTENTQADIQEILALTSDIFLGINFFQFQQALWKAPKEDEFGIFGLGDKVVGSSRANGDMWPVYCLTSSSYPEKKNLAAAVATPYGGSADVDQCSTRSTTAGMTVSTTVSGTTGSTTVSGTTVSTTEQGTVDFAASNSLAWVLVAGFGMFL